MSSSPYLRAGRPYASAMAALHSSAEDVRLSELLVVLSLGADLGMGQPMEHALRQCVLALRIGERLGMSAAERAVLYYVSLISWVGCHIDAYEQAKWFGDDLALKANFRFVDPVGVRSAGQMIRQIGAGRRGMDRAAVAIRFLAGGMRDANVMLHNHAYAADQLARDLGLPGRYGMQSCRRSSAGTARARPAARRARKSRSPRGSSTSPTCSGSSTGPAASGPRSRWPGSDAEPSSTRCSWSSSRRRRRCYSPISTRPRPGARSSAPNQRPGRRRSRGRGRDVAVLGAGRCHPRAPGGAAARPGPAGYLEHGLG